MKSMKNRIIGAAILLLTMSILTLSLSSCGLLTIFGITDGIIESYEDSRETAETRDTNGLIDSTEKIDDITMGNNGDTDDTAGDGTEGGSTVGGNTGSSVENNIVIQGGSLNVAYAAAKGIRSAVSIYAKFSSGSSGGSGVIYKLDARSGTAFILTNYHVVYSNSSYGRGTVSNDIKIYLYGMEQEAYGISATFVGGSPNYDIAVLRIDNSDILKGAAERGAVAAVDVQGDKEVVVGQSAIAIGNAESLGITVTSGIVSVDSEYIEMTAIDGSGSVDFRVIRIDSAVNSGNSGGGLFNSEGKLVGIVNAKIAQSDVENIGYAIPVAVVRAVADNIIHYCNDNDETAVKRPIMGITVQATDPITTYDTSSGTLVRSETVKVTEIDDTAVANGHFTEGDVIKSITVGNKTVEVTRLHHLIDTILDARVGESVSFKVVGTNGQERIETITVTADCVVDY